MADTPAADPSNPNPNPNPAADPSNPNPAPPASKGEGDDAVPQSWDGVFKHPRFKQLNDTANAAKKQLDDAEKAKQDAARQKEIEAGNFQKVIDELTPQATRAKELEAALTSVVEAEMQNIPEARRSLVPDLPPEKKLEWITKNRSFLMDEKKKDVNNPANPAEHPNGDNKRIFTLAQIKDAKFYAENRDEILKAQRDGRVRD